MYVGRIVAIGRNLAGQGAALYRVSSRSFPNRQAVMLGQAVAIVPKPGHENDIQKNPYIAYNCLRFAGNYAIVSNGSQTDPVSEKIAAGMPPRDALAYVMLSLDYEHDSLNTPRITGVISPDGSRGFLAIVRQDALLIREYSLRPGQAFYVCTYERNEPGPEQREDAFEASDAAAACTFIMQKGVFADFDKPVSAACAVADHRGVFNTATA
ncbi:MAG: IMP cyclohydrolase [Oligosphaeraceae bacterium]|nr:IMP cyclohydrolase [Oligosphaeraceae bacterium]